MNTLTIPKELTDEKDLILISRLQYENLLKYFTNNKEYESLWIKASKNNFFKSFNKKDSIYDKV